VINLTDRMGEDVFTAEHKKLLTAIANQVGAAVENARLVESERRRVRLDTELVLARDLQAALMQPQTAVAGGADIGARTQPAEVVGGDFYKFLSQKNQVGVLVGDVSSHGLSAAMLMAHVIAAAGIIAQDSREPDRALQRLLEVIGPELSRAEMHVTLFYAVIDRVRCTLRYANAGHPQAFLLRGDGSAARLSATAPPLGLGDSREIKAGRATWTPGHDTLCVFSDGFPDASDAQGTRYGEDRLLTLVRHHKSSAATAIVDAAFRDVDAFAGSRPADDRTLVIVRG
jgi:sigma-B regulation protein RsbU (phosphoserine phosphatase)